MLGSKVVFVKINGVALFYHDHSVDRLSGSPNNVIFIFIRQNTCIFLLEIGLNLLTLLLSTV